MPVAQIGSRWFREDANRVGDALVTLCDSLEREQSDRRKRCLEAMCRYEARRIPGLHPGAYYRAAVFRTDSYEELRWALDRSICHSVQAKVAGKQRPKPQFVTNGADWGTKRKAKKQDRFVEAQLMQTQGVYEDAWQLGQRVLLDAEVFPTGGAVKISSDLDEERVVLERVFSWELYVDPLEARYGQPLNLFHVYAYDRDTLIDRFPEEKALIEAAPDYEEDEDIVTSSLRVGNQVKVREAWRLPIGKSKGRHIIAVQGAVLVDEPWERKEFPFYILRWTWELMGFGGTSLIEETAPTVDTVNTQIQRMADSVKRTSKSVCFYEEGGVNPEDIESNEDAINIRVKPGAQMPNYVSPQPFSAQDVQWVQMHAEKAFEIPGVSQMSATSRKEPGLTAGVAIRTVQDIETERFSVIFRMYEQMFVALARHIIACTREIASNNPEFAVRWPGKRFLQEIKWSEVDMPEDQYVIQIYPVAGVKNTPADRLQTVQELNAAGKLSDEALIETIKYLDSQKELDGVSKQRELIEQYVEQWLDATPEKEESGEFRYRPPIPYLPSLPDALVQVAQEYLDAELQDAPDYNKEFFRRYMTELDKQILQRQAKAAQAAMGIDPNAPPPPGGVAPMAPAGPPPGPAPAPPPMALAS